MSDPAAELSAMSGADVDQLAERLATLKAPDSLDLEGVDGLFCALVASPDHVRPAAYLPVILGGAAGASGEFSDLADANRTLTLLMRYWNTIVADFERDGVHVPYIAEPGIDGIAGRAWARGFLKGTRLAPSGWNRLWGSANEGQLLCIPVVAGEVDPSWPAEPLTAEKSDELLMFMAAGAGRAYRHFAPARREQAEEMLAEDLGDDGYGPDTYFRPEPKIGRNEPCPCGSGRKYKKCCGAAPQDGSRTAPPGSR